jgi:hypothetical protein
MRYAYHSVTLADATARTAAAFAEHIAATARPAITAAGGELLGLFLPQLGFASNERAVLCRWPSEPAPWLDGCPGASGWVTDRLSATVRPADDDRVPAGGIVVHRWFVIDPADREEFVELSNGAWAGFEGEFESTVFGLFAAEPRAEDGASMRMLLMTRYGGHADWDVSRRPNAESARRFARRRELTKQMRACSTLLAPLT